MIIRIASLNDLDILDSFYYEIVEYLESNINYPCWHHDYPSRETIREAIDTNSQYVAIENGKVIGGFVCNSNPAGNYSRGLWKLDISNKECLFVHTLAVKANYQGRGVASKMINYIKDIARLQKVKSIRLDVVSNNLPAKKLYEKNGFKYAGDDKLDRHYKDIDMFSLYEYVL